MARSPVRLQWFWYSRSSYYAIGLGVGIVIAGALMGVFLFALLASVASPENRTAWLVHAACAIAVLAMVVAGALIVIRGIRQIRYNRQPVIQVDGLYLMWHGDPPLRLEWTDFGDASIHMSSESGTFLRLLPGGGLREHRDLYLDDIDVDANHLVTLINELKERGPSALVGQSAKRRA